MVARIGLVKQLLTTEVIKFWYFVKTLEDLKSQQASECDF